MQNFRQKICFKTEDLATLEMMDKLAGNAKIKRKTDSQSSGESTGKITEVITRQKSESQSITEARESVLDAPLFRSLSSNQAVALLSLDGESRDDVLALIPLYV